MRNAIGTEITVAISTCSTVPTMDWPTPNSVPDLPPEVSRMRKRGKWANTTGPPFTTT